MSTPTSVVPHPDAIRTVLSLVQPGLAKMETSLTRLADTDDPILAPMLSTVLPGSGKRLRPALALLIGRLRDVDPEALNHMAVGVELLHTASLVHDDIVDESDTRHGGATLFARVGNALAVLVGDYLFSQAAQACVATGNLEVVRLFAETLGAMAQGQIDDANRQLGGRHAWESLSRERYYRTISGKTASLFVLACEGTGLLVGLSAAQVDALRVYGQNLGLAFQVVDDVLDFTATEDELGKPVGSDLRQGTITLPVILMRDGDLADGRFRHAFDGDDVDLQIRLVQESDAIDRARSEAETLVARAREALHALPRGAERDALDALAAYVTRRES
ncbi:MAG: polyprenyl synthetase family protein [Chloroflexi bacterium]|nr:polyprenyl synthetase family protein [Chloroflexota bacterium]MBV9133152.1 polyprenyl synthetase family protein [Chloroflexota bacterium]MBV9892868.1 polyprenyl synthetase family protein [Chloroflexota bacterium]